SVGGESLSSDSFKYKFAYNRRGRTVGEFFFNDFCSTPSCARKIGPLPTFELLTPSPTAVSAYSITSTVDTGAIVTEEISAKDISVTDNAIGDHSKYVDEGVSISSPKDGQLIVADAGATGSIPEALEVNITPCPQDFGLTGDFGESLPIVTPLKVQQPHDDGSSSSIDRSARIPDVVVPEYILQNTLEKVKEYIDLVEEEIDVDDSHLESLISNIEKSIKNYSSTNEEIKKELGEEVGKNVMEDVGMANCDIIVSRTLQLQRNKYLAKLSDQERILADFLFYSEYKDVSILSIDENNPAVIQQNEEMRHNLECSVLLDINYINWLIDERKKKEYIESIIAEKEIDLERATDNPCYDTMKVKWLKDQEKMTYRDSTFFADKCRQSMSEWEKMFPNNSIFYADLCHVLQSFLQGNRIKRRGLDCLHHWNRRTIPFTWKSNQNDFDCGVYCIKAMEWYDGWNEKKHPIITLSTICAYTKNLSRCHLAIDLVSYKENRRKQEVFKECALWSARKPFLIQQQKKRKDKEMHLENLRVKRVEKVFLEDEKIKKERERHEQ
ncbi:putative phosphoenolpyruvate synthase regulatory protein, partial [Bienertia sinuspersici]